MGRADDPEEIPYDFLDRDARRRRLAEESRKQDFRHRSAVFQQIERERRDLRFRTALAVIALIFAFTGAAMLYAHNYRMNTYTVDAELTRKGLGEAELFSFCEGSLVLFRDSVSYISGGETVWTENLVFTDPVCVLRGRYFALFERDGGSLLIFGDSGLLCTITMSRKIRTADISASGVTAVVTETDEAAYISYFDRFGSRISVEVKAFLSQTGYPMDIAVSPDGQRLAAAYYSLAGGLGESRLILYDFGNGRESAGYVSAVLDDFRDTMLLDVGFLSNDTLAAVGDDRLRLIRCTDSGAEVLNERTLSDSVEAVFFEAGALAVAEKNGSSTGLELYGASGEKTASLTAPCGYGEIRIGERQVLFRDGSRLYLCNKNGRVRYDGELTEAPVTLCFSEGRSLLVNNGTLLRKITLK